MRPPIIASIAALGFVAFSSFASDRHADHTDAGAWLHILEVRARTESAGYHDVAKIEQEDGVYEVKATAADGRRVKLYLDPRTGEILGQKRRASRLDRFERRSKDEDDRRHSRTCTERPCRDDMGAVSSYAATTAAK